jgi:hypothetical protein
MTDRELLKAAAKAAGIEYSDMDGGARYDPKPGIMQTYVRWNPLVDDGDALRLAVKLDISLDFAEWVQTAFYGVDRFVQEHWNGDDPYAATRRAIVRAAAKMGEADE